MHSRRETQLSPVFLLNSVDCLGRKIDQPVLSIAEEIVGSAVRFAEKLLGDPALATNLFEEAAAIVSRRLRERLGTESGVDNLRGYIFVIYVRLVLRQSRKQLRLNHSEDLEFTVPAQRMSIEDIERKIFLAEALATYDPLTQTIVQRRLEGWSWKEIALACGISAQAARQRYSTVIQRLRSLFQNRGCIPSGGKPTCHVYEPNG